MRLFFVLMLILLISPFHHLVAQTDTLQSASADSVLQTEEHSPRKAALYSALLPGLGQAYNDKYWKIPVVYTALGIAGYSIAFNARYYNDLKNAYLIRTDGDSTTIDEYINILPSEYQVIQYAEFYRKNMEISVIITAAIWTLNIVDALVDAHLYNFDISDDLSLEIRPGYRAIPSGFMGTNSGWDQYFGLRFKLSIQ